MDSIPDWLSVILIVLLVSLSAFFNASETSFACLNRYKFMAEEDAGKKSAKAVLRLADHFETTLITTLTGTNLASIMASTISTFLFFHLFNKAIPDAVISLLASIAMSLVVFLFGDTIPKIVGKKIPDVIARINCYPLLAIYYLLFPITIIFRGITKLFQKLFKAKPEVALTEEDFQSIIDEAKEDGVFEENESEIIQNTFDFADTSVREVFTPIERMTMLDLDGLSTAALLEFLKECPYSRIPVYYRKPDKIAGVLVVKNYLNAYFKDPAVNYLKYVQKPYFVTPRVYISDLLDGFKKHHTQMAIVRAEGNILGMVTMEDVLEELVGAIDERSKKRRRATR